MKSGLCAAEIGAVVLGILIPASAADPVDYQRDIKPILSRRCYACHGALQQKSGLRVDTGAFLHRGGESGAAVEPGKPEESLLIGVVTGEAGFQMPPEGEPLSDQEIALLKAWVAQGASFPQDEQSPEDPRTHWSFQAVKRPPVPAVRNQAWVRNPIDAFVAAAHQRQGLTPNSPAEKATLLRRVHLDLIGLPPTRAQLQAFLADPSDDAYETVVHRLLSSPQYGERWGRHWMDVWRYSDWYGRRAQNEIRYSQYHIWRWRDWIIESLNADKGYDRMILEMLAADEIAPADQQRLRATGFLARNWYKFNRNTWLQQTVEHTSLGFLGLTLKCARCHDHKFDPISQQDYYRFRAFFEPHDVRTDRVPGQPDVMQDGLARVYDKNASAPTYLFERGDDRYPDKDYPLSPEVPEVFGEIGLEIASVPLPVESYYPALQPFRIEEALTDADSKVRKAEQSLAEARSSVAIAQRRLEAFETDPQASQQSAAPFLVDDFSQPRPDLWKPISGRWEHRDDRLLQTEVSNFATLISQEKHPRNFQARVRYRTTDGGRYRSIGVFFDMVGQQAAQAVYTSVGDERQSVQAFHRQESREVYPAEGIVPCSLKQNEEILLEIRVRGQRLDISLNGEPKLEYTMPMPRQDGYFALWNHSGTAEFLEVEIVPLNPTRADVEHQYRQAQAETTLCEKNVEIAQAERDALQARIAAERAKYGLAPAADQQASAHQAARCERRIQYLHAERNLLEAEQQWKSAQQTAHVEGGESKTLENAKKKAASARQAVESARTALENSGSTYEPLGPTFPETSTGRRLALARWIIDRRNPRTARVAVNHIWLRHFDQALVRTVADFGLRSEKPTHPQLLDWLAAELMDHNWSMKHIHRLIVSSSTYRMQSGNGGADNPNLDRDPENRWLWRMNSRRMEAEVVRDSLLYVAGRLDPQMGGPDLDETLGQTSRRRSVYFRVTPDSKMQFLDLFDLANPDECYERRVSVVPQQALAMTNSIVAITNARLLARELANTDSADADFITAAFERVLSRSPNPKELETCQAFLTNHTELLTDPEPLTTFPAGPPSPVEPAADPALRARENLIHVLMSHNDFLTIR